MGKAILGSLLFFVAFLVIISFFPPTQSIQYAYSQADEVDQRTRGQKGIFEYTISGATYATHTVPIVVYNNEMVAMIINTATVVQGAVADGVYWLEGTPNAARIPYTTMVFSLLDGAGTITATTNSTANFGAFYYDVRGVETVRAGYAQGAAGGYATRSITIVRY